MSNILHDETIEIDCAGCKQMIPRPYGYLLRHTHDVCICGNVADLRSGPFGPVLANMRYAEELLGVSLQRLSTVGSAR